MSFYIFLAGLAHSRGQGFYTPAISTSSAVIILFALALSACGDREPATYIPSPDQEHLDPLEIAKYAHDLVIPPVFAPTIVYGDDEKVIRHEYSVFAARTRVQMLPPPFPKTTVLGYGGPVQDPDSGEIRTVLTSPAPTFENIRGIPARVEWRNEIREPHFLPVDPTLHWANPLRMEAPTGPFKPFPPGYSEAQYPVPIVTHIHGLEVGAESDGTPEQWFTPHEHRGATFASRIYDYPNSQPAAPLWYHDHVMGTTRLNVYAGLLGLYFIRDPDHYLDGPASPLPRDDYEIPLVITDKDFYTDGEMYFHREGKHPDIPYWHAENNFNTVVVNGRVWPNLNVERRQYRFRVYAASNERVWTFAFDNGMPFTIIGSDGGYLPEPQTVTEVTLGPPERADILVDFSQFEPGTQIILRNIHVANGVPADPDTVGQVMRFTVLDSEPVPPAELPETLMTMPALIPDAPVRTKVLMRYRDDTWTDRWRTQDGLGFDAPPTEYPLVGSTERWDLVHTHAEDDEADAGTHLMHLHLIQFQILNRQKIDHEAYLREWHRVNGHRPMTRPITVDPEPFFIGEAVTPEPHETGWKDTVLATPGHVTRIVARWAPLEIPAGDVAPGENRFPFDPTRYPDDPHARPAYVWHCHILGHEDHEMMRPLQLVHAWAPGTEYRIGDVVAHDHVNYRARVDHTAGNTEPPPENYDRWARVNNNDGHWQPQIIYAAGDRVIHDSEIYLARELHQAQPDQTPPQQPLLWLQVPATACEQLAEYCGVLPDSASDTHHAGHGYHGSDRTTPYRQLAKEFHAIGQGGNEQACQDMLARALAVCQPVYPSPCSGLCADPAHVNVAGGEEFDLQASGTGAACYETSSALAGITGALTDGQQLLVNGRVFHADSGQMLPPTRNHGYCIQVTGAAGLSAN